MIPAPATVAELAKILAGANARKEKVERVNLTALNRIVEHTPEDMTVTVETGITLTELQKHIGQRRQWLAIDPPHPETTTIGDIINANSSGPRRFGCGTIRDYLIGLTAVLADGTVIHSGGKVVKNVAGYDLMKLFIGGQGTVGVVVEATFKLRPLPEAEQFLAATCESLEVAGKLIESVIQSEITPIVLDLYGEPLNAVNAFFSPAGRPEVQKPPVIKSYNVVVGFAGSREEVEWQLARAAELGFARTASLDYDTAFWAMPEKVYSRSVLPSKLTEGLRSVAVPCLVRAGNGIIYFRGTPTLYSTHQAIRELTRRLKDAYDPNHIFPEPLFAMKTESQERFLDYDKSLACIHCGLCLGSCPTYLETGNENDSPRGRIYLMRAVQDGRLPLGDTAVRHIDLCLGCRACEAVCPSGVQYGDLLEHTRDHIEHHYQRSTFQTFLRRIAIEKVFPFPWRMKLALLPAKITRALHLQGLLPKFAREALSLIPEDASAEPLPLISPATTALASSPSPPSREKVGVRGLSTAGDDSRAGFISGCVMSVLFGKTNAASVRLLNRAGYEVVTPPEQGCCGALYAHSGQLELARACARHNIEVFEKHHLSSIVINAAGCGSTLKEYGQLLRDDLKWAERARQFSAKVKDLTEMLAESSQHAPRTTQNVERVTYHDACHLAHPQHITKQPRQLVRALVGDSFVELPESDVCCGSAGSYNLTEPEMAERLQRRKVDNILKTGAKVVVTTNPGCLLQIRAGLKKAGAHDVEALHIADFLDRAAQ